MTNLVDVVVDADGELAQGQVTIHWPMFMVGSSAITQGQKTYAIVDGELDLDLYQTVSAQPNGSYYTATFQLDNGSVYDEYWVVPDATTVKLNQVRAMFPPAPGIFINSLQITGGNARIGQFLGWNGNQWVPMNVTTISISPNTIGLTVSSNPDADISVPVPNAALGSGLTLNIPDAGLSSRGVVTTGAQQFAGSKLFQDGGGFNARVSFGRDVVFQPTTPSSNPPSWGSVWLDSSSVLRMVGSVAIQNPDASLGSLSVGHLSASFADLSPAALSNTVANPQSVILPGQEAIRLPGGSSAHGIGVDSRDWLWLGSGTGFAALRPDAAWVANWIDMSPYQHPIAPGAEASPSQASVVLYQDATQWIGMGVDTNMRIWFRIGPNGAGQYYHLAPDGGSMGVYTWVNSSLVAQRAGINLIAGQNVTISATDNAVANTVDVVISAAGNLVDPLTTRGDLIVRGVSIPERLPAVYDGVYRVLACDQTSILGLSWNPGVPTTRRILAGPGLLGGGDLSGDVNIWASVLSVFGRTGNVVLTATDISNAGGVADPTTLKGDLLVRSELPTVNRGLTRLPVGPNGSVLMADTAQITGLKWAPANLMNLPTTAPAAGSQLLWADPADGYRVKWAV